MSVWSFILTLVRSLRALVSSSFPRRTADTTPNDALARAQSRLRPILLTPRSIGARPVSPGIADAPKCDPELGLPGDLPGPPPSATSFREGTPDTSGTGSSCVAPLTPPDRCYLAPLPSATDCPYTESWPTNAPLDRTKSRLLGSPLKASFPEPMVAPIGSPPPGRWSTTEVWTSTPCKNDSPIITDPVLSSFDHPNDPSSAQVNISHAIITRSQSSIMPYDDASHASMSSDGSQVADDAHGAGKTRERCRAQAHVLRSKDHPYPRFHHPDAYACSWHRHGVRLPGKAKRTHARAHSHMDLQRSEWYDAVVYAPSPVAALSPPLRESTSEDEDEETMPLGRLRERLTRRNARLGMAVHPERKVTAMSPRTRRMSEGCLLAMSESTPTRVGVSTRSSRHAISLAFNGGDHRDKDLLEALSLRFSPEKRNTVAPKSESCMALSSLT